MKPSILLDDAPAKACDFHESTETAGHDGPKTHGFSGTVDKNIHTCNTFIAKPNSNQQRNYITTIIQQTLDLSTSSLVSKKTEEQQKPLLLYNLPLSFLWVFHTDIIIPILLFQRSPDTRMIRGCTEASND